MTDEQIARETWEALSRHYGAGTPVATPFDQLHPTRQAECVRRIRWCRERGIYPAIIADQIEAADNANANGA